MLLSFRVGFCSRYQNSNAFCLTVGLCPDIEWPQHRSAERHDEIASVHVTTHAGGSVQITSSSSVEAALSVWIFGIVWQFWQRLLRDSGKRCGRGQATIMAGSQDRRG